MNFLLSEKKLILLFCVLFTVSATFLFWQNKRELDPQQGKSWWILSFAQPEDLNSLAFTITNYTSQNAFSYEVTSTETLDTVLTESGTANILPGETKIITPNFVRNPRVRTSVTVTANGEKQEIYR